MGKRKPPLTPMDLPKNFIREWRTFRGLSQAQLGKLCNTAHVTILRYEKGQTAPNVEMLQRIALALNIDAESLMTRDPTQDDGTWEFWAKMSAEERRFARAMVEAQRALARQQSS